MTKRYFSYIGWTYSCKNALHKAIFEHLKTQDRQIILGEYLPTFKADILGVIAQLNTLHSRCNPVTAFWTQTGGPDGDLHLSLGGGLSDIICLFKIYRANN